MSVAIASCIAFPPLATYSVITNRDTITYAFIDKAVTISRLLDSLVRERSDFNEPRKLLNSLQKTIWLNPDVLWIDVNKQFDDGMKTFSSSRSRHIGRTADVDNVRAVEADEIIHEIVIEGSGRLMKVISPIHIGKQQIGTFEMWMTLETVDYQVKKNVFFTVSTYLALLLVFCGILFVSLRIVVIRPFQELNSAREAAEKANGAKTEFLSSMNHELRTPMNAILGFAQMLKLQPNEPLTETQENSINHILKSGNHLLELISQVLELNKIEAGKLSLNIDHVSARDTIDESLDLIPVRADDEGIKIIDQTTRDNLPQLWTDSTRLTQVLLNLLSNAVKYNGKDGTVTLSCEEIPGEMMLRINITDTGKGIPVRQQDDLFKPFERLGREAGEIEGTGIGLTISKQIVELLGGKIGFESEWNKGSTFWVDVPMSSKQADAEKKTGSAQVTTRKVENRNNHGPVRTILYVEDNPDNLKLMESIIGHIENTRLLTAYSAELGLDLARKENPDLILMDINLPGMNGNEALKQLQNTEQTKDIPVIAVTAAVMPQEMKAGKQAGFRDYITKPVKVAEVIRTLEETLDSIKSSD